MQPLLLARCHLYVIYPNLGVIWTWVCVMHLATGRTRSSEQHFLDIPRMKLASFGDRSLRVIGQLETGVEVNWIN